MEDLAARIDALMRALHLPGALARHRELRAELGAGEEAIFEFFSDRYERRATALTTNLPFAQWPQVFGDETMTVACSTA